MDLQSYKLSYNLMLFAHMVFKNFNTILKKSLIKWIKNFM